MLELLFIAALVLGASGVGARLLDCLVPDFGEPTDRIGVAIPLGFGFLALAALFMGEIGVVNRSTLLGMICVGAIPGAKVAWVTIVRSTQGFRHARPSNFIDVAFGIALLSTVLGTLLTAMAPVTDGDALCYHLQVPKEFLARGAVFFDPDLHETVYPLLTELLYAYGLALRGPEACRLIQWVFGLVFAANVTVLARPSLGKRAWWAGTIALLVPAVSNGMSAPLNDVALAAFGSTTLVVWSRWYERPDARSALLAGIMAGLGMGVKYPALVLTGLLGMTILARPIVLASVERFGRLFRAAVVYLRATSTRSRSYGPHGMAYPGDSAAKNTDADHRRRSALGARGNEGRCDAESLSSQSQNDECQAIEAGSRTLVTSPMASHAAIFGLAALMVGGAWYLRAWAYTGNPVYPFFRSVFGGAGLDEVLDPIKRPLAVTVVNLLTAIGPLTLEPARFDSFSHQFGPVFLLFLPALLLERAPRRVLGIAAVGYGFLILCLTQRQSMRFLLIAIGPMSVAVAWLASTWWDRRSWPGRAIVGVLLLVLAFESSLAMARARHGLPVVLGRETREHFLARREPTFRVGRWVAENLPADARLVGQDHRGYYIPRPYTMELAHRRRTGLGSRGESPRQIVERLQQEGFTHVMLCPPIPESAVEFDPTLSRRLAPWSSGRPPVFREVIEDADGVRRRYEIYPLSEPLAVRDGGEARR